QEFVNAPTLFRSQITTLERTLLANSTTTTRDDGLWRKLGLPAAGDANGSSLLVVLCDKTVHRPIVKAFRDVTLAQLKAEHLSIERSALNLSYLAYQQQGESLSHARVTLLKDVGVAINRVADEIKTGHKAPSEVAGQLYDVAKRCSAMRDL